MYYEHMNDISDYDRDVNTSAPTITSSANLTPRQAMSSNNSMTASELECEPLVSEFDEILEAYRSMSNDQHDIEKVCLDLCQIIKSEQENWRVGKEQLHVMASQLKKYKKDVHQMSTKLQGVYNDLQEEQSHRMRLQSRLEDMERAFALMQEIVFDDDNIQIGDEIRETFAEVKQRYDNSIHQEAPVTEMKSDSPIDLELNSFSEPESDLNAMYGELYAQRNSQNALPAPSSRGARMLDHQQVKAAEYMSSTPSVNFQQVSPIKRALKISPVVKTRLAPQPASPKPRSKLAEEPSFVEDMIVAEEIYQQKKYEDVPMTMVKAPETVPTELVFYVSALANKLNHHDLYVTSPETEEVEVIDNIKKLLRNGEYDDEEMLDHLWMQSTNVLCQLMKDFFDDSKVKIFEAESDSMMSLMQAVRCCNTQSVQDHLIALAPKQRSQLAFLLQHLQGAMAAGRSPGELADAFGSVLVSQGSKNKNDPKEMLEKLLSLDVTFVRDLLDASKTSGQEAAYSTMLGPVGTPRSKAFSKMIEERKNKLLQNCDIKLFTQSPKN